MNHCWACERPIHKYPCEHCGYDPEKDIDWAKVKEEEQNDFLQFRSKE